MAGQGFPTSFRAETGGRGDEKKSRGRPCQHRSRNFGGQEDSPNEIRLKRPLKLLLLLHLDLSGYGQPPVDAKGQHIPG
jgi:hypothetical protein